jgi:glycosyltransferase involved in cell wall biosynthesis
MTKVSFIIPSYNSVKTINDTLESILNQESSNLIKEVILVDSSDDLLTRKSITSLNYPKLKTIFLDKKTLPALGRNIGAKESTGELLCFIDSDVCLDSHWLSRILEANSKGCRVGGGSVAVLPAQKDKTLVLAQFYLQCNEYIESGLIRKIAMVPGCNMFVERQLFDEVGGFPDIRASEEVLLCLTLGKITPVWFIPAAKCFHVFREDKESYLKNQIMLGRYIIIYRRRIYNKFIYKGIWPLLFLPGFLLIKLIRIIFRISIAGHFKYFLKSLPLFLTGLFYWGLGFGQGSLSYEE